MEKLLQLLFSGVALGAIYALLALGFVIVFKATQVVNFAHAGLLMVGTYCVARFRTVDELPFAVAVLLGIAVAVVVALLVERVLVRPVVQRSVVAVAIMTIGVDVVLQTEITRRLGIDIVPVGDPWQSATVDVLGITVPQTRVAALLVALVVLGGFFAWSRFSDWGIAMRASAENHDTAELMGIRLGRVSAMVWLIAAVLAVLAGVFLAAFPSPGVSPTTSAASLRAFPAAILGGLDSTGGALAGGLLIGLAETLTQGYQDQLSFLGEGFSAVMPYVVMVGVLLARPTGLFGAREASRV
ncbi:MAG TPA: branched-chain amino acid ABC transporter permease [Acidimicrobiales bacterium]